MNDSDGPPCRVVDDPVWPRKLDQDLGRTYVVSWMLVGRPRAYYTGFMYVVESTWERARRGVRDALAVIAHELGHAQGLDHPDDGDLAGWAANVMGYGLRLRDPHGLIPQAREYVEEVEASGGPEAVSEAG